MKADSFFDLYLDSGISTVHLLLARFICSRYGRTDNGELFNLVVSLSLLFERGHLRLPVEGIKDELEILSMSASDKERDAVLRLCHSLDDPLITIMENSMVFAYHPDGVGAERSPFVLLDEKVKTVTTEKLYYLEKRFIQGFISFVSRGAAAGSSAADVIEPAGIDDIIKSIEKRRSFTLEDMQRQAVLKTLRTNFSVIAGGPGTGKSSVISFIIESHLAVDPSLEGLIAVAAPTGRAAGRLDTLLGELTSQNKIEKPRTVHRLLGIGYGRRRNRIILPYRMIIIDESSMLDIEIMKLLMDSLRDDCTLVMVGDPHQLPSVGAGTVFSDILEEVESEGHLLHSRYVKLDRIKRSGGKITELAGMIQEGRFDIGRSGNTTSDAVMIFPTEFDSVFSLACEKFKKLTQAAADGKGGIVSRALSSFALLTPCNSGQFGVDNLNEKLLNHFSPGKKRLFPGLPVMIVKNDYKNALYNGDRGILVFDREQGLLALFIGVDGEERKIPVDMLKNWEISYAQTVHKSQGNEYDTIAFVVEKSAVKLLTREIIYTAVTRARSGVYIYGDSDILEEAVKKTVRRYSGIGGVMVKTGTAFP